MLCPSVRRSVGHGDQVGKCENAHFHPCPPVRNWYWPCIRPCYLNNFFTQDFTRSDSESTLLVALIHFLDEGDIADTEADSTLPYVEEGIECCPSVELQTEEVKCLQWLL